MIVEIIILILAIPIGLLIAYLTRDELLEGRKWFKIIMILGVVGMVWFLLTGVSYLAYTFGFVTILAFVSFIKSKDKKWIERKI